MVMVVTLRTASWHACRNGAQCIDYNCSDNHPPRRKNKLMHDKAHQKADRSYLQPTTTEEKPSFREADSFEVTFVHTRLFLTWSHSRVCVALAATTGKGSKRLWWTVSLQIHGNSNGWTATSCVARFRLVRQILLTTTTRATTGCRSGDR